MKHKIRLFGIYRDLFNQKEIELHLPEKMALGDLRAVLADELARREPAFKAETLLAKTAIASGNQILAENESLTPGLSISLLPPVCGG